MNAPFKSFAKRTGAPRWMVTFADLMALLLALFVMLLSFAEIDSDNFRKNAGPISEAFHTRSLIKIVPTLPKSQRLDLNLEPDEAEIRTQQKEAFLDSLRADMAGEIADARVQVLEQADEVVVRFPDRSAFASGSMELAESILPTLDKIAKVLEQNTGRLRVAGHTDDTPIATQRIRSNWDLSTARAVSVVHYLLGVADIDPARITAQGFADSRPLAPNDSPENRAINRRVEISVEFPGREDAVN